MKSILMAGKEAHITNPNGTDLKVNIENRPVIVSDGILSPEDLQKGYATSQVYLPAGVVTSSIGNNIRAGGDNKSQFGYPFFLTGCTVIVDGKTLVDKGNLKY